jgi:acyl carrier protein
MPVAGLAVRLEDTAGRDSWCGELVLEGAGLALGYWGDAALTAARFRPAGRYRTGDLGYRRPDGQLVWLGRRDGQLKLRGYRIEPGEIEAVLSSHPQVAASAVVLREPLPGEGQLVAYVVAAAELVESGELAAWARARLAPWQQPSAWVALAGLPRLANGKLDRRALPAPARPAAGLRPQTELEAQLAGLWQELLGVSAVTAADDFFALGGHSLLATRLVARIRERMGRELPLLEVFAHPVLSELAAALEKMPRQPAVTAIRSLPRDAGGPSGRVAK